MSDGCDPSQAIIWATRGRTWGNRFLLRGGLADPLLEYERAIAALPEGASAWARVEDKVTLRLPDPDQRRDASGRLIPHEFVVSGQLARSIESIDDGLQKLWPIVAAAYADVWNDEKPPSTEEIENRVTGSTAW